MSLFRPAQNEAVRMKACFYGKPGVTKTRTALAFPSPVVIDLEKGTALYGGEFNFHVLRTQDVNKIESAIDELMKDPGEFRTLVIDPISVYCDLIQEDFLKQKRVDTMDPNAKIVGTEYGQIKSRIRRFIHKMLSLDLNIIITSREKGEYAKGKFMEQIGVSPDMHKEIPHMFDTIIYVFIDSEGKIKGIAHPDIEPGVTAKDRSKLPHEIFDFNYDNLQKYWGEEGLSRGAEAITSNQSFEETSSRDTEVTRTNGSIIKTAGITSEQIDAFESKLKDDPKKESEFTQYLSNKFGVSHMLDLRADEAELILNQMK